MDNFHNSMGLESPRRNASKLSVRECTQKFKGGKLDPKCEHHPVACTMIPAWTKRRRSANPNIHPSLDCGPNVINLLFQPSPLDPVMVAWTIKPWDKTNPSSNVFCQVCCHSSKGEGTNRCYLQQPAPSCPFLVKPEDWESVPLTSVFSQVHLSDSCSPQ